MQKTNKKRRGAFFDRILGPLFDSIGENAENSLKKITDFAFFKSTYKRYMVFFSFVTAALIIVLHGLGLFINTYFAINLWVVYIFLGVITYFIGRLYLKGK